MKTMFLFALALALAVTGPAMAQDSVTGTNNASADSGSQSGASAGAQLVQNSYQGGTLHESISSQVPMSIVGYGSFSQNNCVNGEGMGATTKIFSFNFVKGKPDIHCYQGVLSDQFGRESQLARSHGLVHEAEDLRSMGVWASCMSDEMVRQMCLDMGKIRQVGNRYVPVPSQEIPHHDDPNWRGVSKGPNLDSAHPSSPIGPQNSGQPVAQTDQKDNSSNNGRWMQQPWVQTAHP